MKKDYFEKYGDWNLRGEFKSSGTIDAMCGCIISISDTETTSSEGVKYLERKYFLKQISTIEEASNLRSQYYLVVKYSDEDQINYLADYNEDKTIEDNEDILAMVLHPGLVVRCYIGSDYINSAGEKLGLASDIDWDFVSRGDNLFFNERGQLTTDNSSSIVRAVMQQKYGLYIYVSFVKPFSII